MKETLSARLMAAAELVPRCDTLADIGTDHGYLPAFLLKNGIISRAICTDINLSPLERARRNFIDAGLSELAEFRFGDGLDVVLPHEADAVVIAGMGGETIADIIERGSPAGDERVFILSPMTKPERLRRYLAEHGFAVVDWRLCRERGKIRECLRAERASPENALVPEISPLYFYVGRRTPQTDGLYPEYIRKTCSRLEKELNGLLACSFPDEKAEQELRALICELKQLL